MENISEDMAMEHGALGVSTNAIDNSSFKVDPKDLKNAHNGAGLSVVSKMYDVEGKGFLSEAQKNARGLDYDGKGHLDADQVVKLVDQKMQIELVNKQLRKAVVILIIVAVLLALSNLGTAFAAARLAKDTQISSYGSFQEKGTGKDITMKATVPKTTFENVASESRRHLDVGVADAIQVCLSANDIETLQNNLLNSQTENLVVTDGSGSRNFILNFAGAQDYGNETYSFPVSPAVGGSNTFRVYQSDFCTNQFLLTESGRRLQYCSEDKPCYGGYLP